MSHYRKDFNHGEETLSVSLQPLDGDRFVVHVGDEVYELTATMSAAGRLRCTLDGKVFDADCAPCAGELQVRVNGRTWRLLPAVGARRDAAEGTGVVAAPMTGTVLEVLVSAGDAVTQGQTLVVLSAMKMEHKLVAGVAGTIEDLPAAAGATVQQGDVLVRIAE